MHPLPPFKAFLHLPLSPSLPQALQASGCQAPAWSLAGQGPPAPHAALGRSPTPRRTLLHPACPVSWGCVLESQCVRSFPRTVQSPPSRCSASLASPEAFAGLPTRTGWDCSSDLEEGPGNSLHTHPGPPAGPYGRQGRNPALTSLGARMEKEKQGRALWSILPYSYHPQAWE